ncbi:TPA: glycoside hydrolase family 88 protein [Streptococcus suis]|nr:glycoside hydrolase family 88 protein [Streptococcus suis]
MREIWIDPIFRSEEYKQHPLLTKSDLEDALTQAVDQVRLNCERFDGGFPSSYTNDYLYSPHQELKWTNGFWPGMIWLAYDVTKDDYFKVKGQEYSKLMREYLDQHPVAPSHHFGLLYQLSCVADYRSTGSLEARKTALLAAQALADRYQEKGQFIQALGEAGDAAEYRLMIEGLMNLQLLFFAYKETGEQIYLKIARQHFRTSVNTVIRSDSSTFRSFYFDPEAGHPLHGMTRRGFSDDSSWARGQAWAIYGTSLTYGGLKDPLCIDLFKGVTDYFLNELPEDHVSYWDLLFGDGDDQAKDSSATVIAICGIHEMLKFLPEVDEDKETYRYAMHDMLRSILINYRNSQPVAGEPLLLQGVYSWQESKGVNQGTIFGDYFYLEALVRFTKDWQSFWK